MSQFKEMAKLNEKEAFTDLLILEKQLMSLYTTVMAESVSDGFRAVVSDHLREIIGDQFSIFLQMSERGFYKVQSATEEQKQKVREEFGDTLKGIE
ncbi:MAG: spore coat protein [Clostridia bacterium]|nr:spore coat protein [Clostridia bacterium]